jgi:hypothetical protein
MSHFAILSIYKLNLPWTARKLEFCTRSFEYEKIINCHGETLALWVDSEKLKLKPWQRHESS